MEVAETHMYCKQKLKTRFEHAGLERDVKSLSSFHLQDFLRKYEPTSSSSRYHDFKPVWMNKKEFINLKTTNAIQKNVIKRLYYDEKPKFSTVMDFKKGGANYEKNILPEINQVNMRQSTEGAGQVKKKRCISNKFV